jgi:hypothetical protein
MLMTKDQRAASRDPLAFAIRKLKEVRQHTGVDWRHIIDFALFDLKLTQARKKARRDAKDHQRRKSDAL